MPLTRRGFLRGSALAAAACAGGAAFPLHAFGQDPPAGQRADEPASDEAKSDEAKKQEKPSAEKKDGDKPSEEDPFKVTKKDEEGRDYRICPQCGFNMYKQDRTWTCENCGYSYVE